MFPRLWRVRPLALFGVVYVFGKSNLSSCLVHTVTRCERVPVIVTDAGELGPVTPLRLIPRGTYTGGCRAWIRCPLMDLDATDDGRLRLAQELLDFILDHLHYDSESLKRCALASKSLLPTCQRHLFSTYQITKSDVPKLAKFFALPASADDPDEGVTLQARVANLLNTYTTDLILTDHPMLDSGCSVAHLPGFKNVQRITFKGGELNSAISIPSFLSRTWKSPSSHVRSVEFDFRLMCERGILESLCILPPTVEDVGFTCAKSEFTNTTAASIRKVMKRQLLPGRPGLEVRQFNGTLKLRLSPYNSHGELLSVMLELGDLFKFSLKRINYRLTSRSDIRHLASLVYECKDTLESLDLVVSPPRKYRM